MNNEKEPTVSKTAAFLKLNGFEVCDEGYLECECGCNHLFVHMRIAKSSKLVTESDRLIQVLGDIGVTVVKMGAAEGPTVQATYDPADKTCILSLFNVDL